MADSNKKIEELLADDSFIRWIEGSATPREVADWNTWLKQDPVRREWVKEARRLHSGFGFKKTERSDVEEELERLNQAVDRFEFFKKRQKWPAGYTGTRFRYMPRVAAAIAFLAVVVAVAQFLNPEVQVQEEVASVVYSTATTDYGEKKLLSFSDGSVITLNANSSLTYPSTITGGEFKVRLEGEAWFEVNSENLPAPRTFRVHTRDGRAEVLGTRFNVNTYRSGTEVVLQEGKVRVQVQNEFNRNKIDRILAPGELARFSYGGETIQVEEVNTELYTSWIQDRLTFDRAPLAEVAERIEQIYGVEFFIDPSKLDLDELRISGSLPNDDLQVFLNALEGLLEHPVELADGKIQLGTPAENGG